MSTWDFRFVNMPSGNGGEDWFELREVYYNEDNSLFGHASPCLGSETPEGVAQLAKWWQQAASAPPLHEKDFPEKGFPDDFEPYAHV
jgi:hypothetical protein